MDILVNVINQKLKTKANTKRLVSGTQKFIRFKFSLDDAWDGLSVFAQFIQNGKAYNDYLDENNSVYLPPEIKDGKFDVLLYGSGSNTIATTNYLTFEVDKNILISDAQSTEITESLYNKLVNIVETYTSQLSGTPTPASSVSLMTNHQTIYLYTGSEDGYVKGDLYYYLNGELQHGTTYGVSDEIIKEDINAWFDAHPEATVMDGTITEAKLAESLRLKAINGYITPEMYGAVGDGVTDDTQAIQDAVANGGVVSLKREAAYLISGAITLTKSVAIYGNGATIKQDTAHTNTLYASGVSNIIIDGVHIIGYGNDYIGKGGQTAPFGIHITATEENRVSDIVIKNCIIDHCTWCGIDVSHADNVLIENNKVVGTGDKDLQYESNYQFGITFGYGDNIKV